jgi:hypothetical protein
MSDFQDPIEVLAYCELLICCQMLGCSNIFEPSLANPAIDPVEIGQSKRQSTRANQGGLWEHVIKCNVQPTGNSLPADVIMCALVGLTGERLLWVGCSLSRVSLLPALTT